MSNTLPGFGEDAESDNEDFNPQAAIESENEDNPSPEKTKKRHSGAASGEDQNSDPEDDRTNLNGDEDEPAPEQQRERTRKRRRDEDDDEEEPDGEGADDEDAEGSGEDLGDDDEDDDAEDDEDDEDQGPRRKRAKRDKRNPFLDVEAEVEDEGEEDAEDDYGEPNEFVADVHPDDEGLDAGAEADDRRHRELDIERQKVQDMDLEAQAERYRQKYGRNQPTSLAGGIPSQRALLPNVDDPKIWVVKCKPGKEREIVTTLARRTNERALAGQPPLILSAFEKRDISTVGYVYIEARSQPLAFQAVESIPFAYARSMNLIEVSERPDLLKVKKTKLLEPGQYVRIKRGKYQGDLAQVEEVDTTGFMVEASLVPRLDYGNDQDANAPPTNPPQRARGTSAKRPPQRLFNEFEAKKKNAKYLTQQASYNSKEFTYFGDRFVRGLLIKEFRINHLQTENVNPKLEEVAMFTGGIEEGADNLDLQNLASTLKANSAAATYLPDDFVEVFTGEQKGVKGRATSVRGDIISIKVTEGDLAGQPMEAPAKTLRKVFREGDHVKIIGGSKYQDEVGMVVRIKDDRVTLLSDSNNQEITVFSKDLRAAADSSMTYKASIYDLHDLVQLDPSTVAIVIKVDRETLRVLDQNGNVRQLLPSAISNRLEKRKFAIATDRDGVEIRHDDNIKEAVGEQRQGTVKHIHRNFLFCLNRSIAENNGVFVLRASSAQTMASRGARGAAGPDLNKMNISSANTGGANGAGTMPPPRQSGIDHFKGKTVAIKRGRYKGYRGFVMGSRDEILRVETPLQREPLLISKSDVNVKDPVTDQTIDMSRFGGPPASRPTSFNAPGRGGLGAGFGGNATPRAPGWAAEGSRTPAMNGANGGRTPGWYAAANTASSGGKTPGWHAAGGGGAGNATPGWKQPGARQSGSAAAAPTPSWKSSAGNRTAYGGGGAGTSYGGATTYGGGTSYGGQPSWVTGATTPYHPSASAFSSGSKTPGAGSHGTSGGFGMAAPSRPPHSTFAQTPGASGGGMSAPTPGAMAAPTPGASGNTGATAPTPGTSGGLGVGEGANGVSAPTPGGFGGMSAETPGASGGGD